MTEPTGAQLTAAGVVGDESYRRAIAQAQMFASAPDDGLNPGFLAIVGAVFTAIEVISTAVKTAKLDGPLFGVLAGAAVVARELREPLEKKFPGLAAFIGKESGRVGNIIGAVGDNAINELADAAFGAAGDSADATDLAPLKSLAGQVAATEAHKREEARVHLMGQQGFVDQIERTLAAFPQKLFEIYTGILSKNPEQLPGDVTARAGKAVTTALGAGMLAQITAAALSSIPYVNDVGLHQAVAFFADFAGFQKISGPVTEPTINYALALPAEYQAARWFRTRRPAPADVREQAFQRHVTLEDYAESLRLAGFPEDWIQVLVKDTFVDPRPRELLLLAEGAEPDPVWLAAKLREVGWDDDDVRRGTQALQDRISAAGRNQYVGALVTEFTRGRIPYARLAAELDNTVKNPELRSFHLGRATYQRQGVMMEELGDAVVQQYRDDVIGELAAREALEALSFPRDEIARRVALAGLRRNQVAVKRETGALEAGIRQVRTEAFANLRVQYRAGFLDRESALVYAEALGFPPAYAENVLAIEDLKGPPSSKVGELPMGVGALEDAAATIAEFVDALAIRRQISSARALELLVQAGVPLSAAERQAALLEILLQPPDGSVAWPFADLKEDDLMFSKLAGAVVGLLEAGFGGKGALTGLLDRLGVSGDTGAAVTGVLNHLLTIFGRRKDRTRGKTKTKLPDEPAAPTGEPPPEPPTPEDPNVKAELALAIRAAYATLRQLNFEIRQLQGQPIPEPAQEAEPLEDQSLAYLRMVLTELDGLVQQAREELLRVGGTLPPGITEEIVRLYGEYLKLFAVYAGLVKQVDNLKGPFLPRFGAPLPLESIGDPAFTLQQLVGELLALIEGARSVLALLYGGVVPGTGGTVTRPPPGGGGGLEPVV